MEKFINKATANHPENRFSNDEEAIKAIPQFHKRRFRNIDILMAIFIIGGLLSVIIKNKTVPNLEESNEENHDIEIIASEIIPDSVQFKKEKLEKSVKVVSHESIDEEIKYVVLFPTNLQSYIQ